LRRFANRPNFTMSPNALGLAGLLLAGTPTTEAAAPDSARRLDSVQVTATRRPESTLEVPVAATVLTREQLRRAAPQTVMDALHGEPGTFVQQTTPGQAVVIVRGLKGSEVLHLVDGFRLNNAIFRNAPNQYIALVDSQMLDRIEVVRGPMSTLYGGDAMGGVIQMLSASPRLDGTERGSRSSVRTLIASADRSILSRVESAFGDERFVLSGGVTYQNVNDLRVGGGERLDFSGFTARGGEVKLQLAPFDAHEFVLQAQSFEQPKTPRHDELRPGFGQAQPTSSTFFFEPQRRDFAQLRWRAGLGLAGLERIDAQLGRQEMRDDRRTRDFGSSNEERERNAVSTDGISITADTALGDAHHVSFGLEHYEDEVRSASLRRNIATGAVSPRTSRFPDRSRMRQSGVFVSDDWHLTERLDLIAGLRYSRVRTLLPARDGAAGVRVSNDDLSGNAGLNYALGELLGSGSDLRLIANVGRGFRAPNVFDLGSFGARPGNRFNIPNPALAPERVSTIDAGFKFARGRSEGELIAFASRYRDKITSVLTGERTQAGQLVVQSRNAARLALRGIEAGISHQFDDTLGLRASATYTRGDETLEGSEDPADRIPPLFGRIGARWSMREDLELEGYAFYAARQDRLSPRDRVDPRIDPDGSGGWATLNLRAAWRPHPDLDLALRLENLADKRYREHGSGLDEPGRNAILTLDWRF
jgi:outer membrane receptor protein involved in Fe transport